MSKLLIKDIKNHFYFKKLRADYSLTLALLCEALEVSKESKEAFDHWVETRLIPGIEMLPKDDQEIFHVRSSNSKKT